MRTNKILLFLGVLALAAPAAATLTFSIVSSFQSPAANYHPTGLDYYNGHLYHFASTQPGFWCYETNMNGSVISSFTLTYNITGLEANNTELWATRDIPSGVIFKYTTNGSLISSFTVSFLPGGITKQGSDLWVISTTPSLYKMTTNGSVISSYSVYGSHGGDIDFSGQYLWYTGWGSAPYGIYKYTTTGSLVDSAPSPNGARPSGCCWDGTYLWFHDYNPPNYCFKTLCYSVAVEPVSFGKVKAIFR